MDKIIDMDNFESDLDELLMLYSSWQLADFNYHNYSVESIKKMEEDYWEARRKFLKYGDKLDTRPDFDDSGLPKGHPCYGLNGHCGCGEGYSKC